MTKHLPHARSTNFMCVRHYPGYAYTMDGNPEPESIVFETVNCPLCGGTNWDPLVTAADPLSAIPEFFQVVRCQDCGMAYTNPRPALSCISRYYPEGYAPHRGSVMDRAGDRSWKVRLEHAVLRARYGYPPQPPTLATHLLACAGLLWFWRARQRAAWIPYTGQGKILDFGCGASRFLQRMQTYGWEAHGIDTEQALPRIAISQPGVRLYAGTLPHSEIEPSSFDVITLWNALEHVHHPRQVLAAAHQALKPGGLLVIGVPNLESWSFQAFGPEWFGLELPRHLLHFTPRTLTLLLQSEGFQSIRITQVGRPSWIHRSACRSTQTAWMTQACRFRPVASLAAFRTQRAGRADYLRVMASRASTSRQAMRKGPVPLGSFTALGSPT